MTRAVGMTFMDAAVICTVNLGVAVVIGFRGEMDMLGRRSC